LDTINLKEHEEAHRRYTQHLAEAMGRTKETLVMQILGGDSGGMPLFNERIWEKEIDFE